MRLQLTTTVRACSGVVLLLASTASLAQEAPDTSARVDVYSDEWITVISPSVMAKVEPTHGVEASARYTVDMLSGATQVMTTDVITSATRFAEERHEAELNTNYTPTGTWSVGAAYIASFEPDYQTHAVGANGAIELFERLSRLTLAYHLKLDTVGLVDDQSISENANAHLLDFSWTQVLDRNTVAAVLISGSVWQCGDVFGCHGSPYRYVPIMAAGDSNSMMVAIRERHPAIRIRGAAALRVSRYLFDDVALHGGYRIYGDNWQIIGHTADVALAIALLDDRLLLRAEGRLISQSEASFYRDRYEAGEAMTGLPNYRSADRELSGILEAMSGVRIEWTFARWGPFKTLRLNGKASRYWYEYPNYSLLSERNAWLIGGGASATF